ncbi:hypothetical protein ACJJTC_000413, partial [Scirpophaga incertulas]
DMTRQSIPVATKAPSRVTRNNQMRLSNAGGGGAYTNGHGGDTTGRRGAENVPPPAQAPANSRVTQQFTATATSVSGGRGGTGTVGGVMPASSAASVPAATGAVRRSNVVKEVERLKENRERRRQRQAELKEEK